MGRIRSRNITIALVSFVFALLIAAYAYSRPLGDFVEYWTAAHLLIANKNPYSIAEMLHLQQALGWKNQLPLIPLNPPWTLAFLAPLGLATSYALGWLAWFSIQTVTIAISSRMLMDMYFGDVKIREVSDSTFYRSLFAFTFFPILLCLEFGQIAPLVLLGVAGFMYFEYKGEPARAGALFALTAVKPQLVYLVWIALLLQCLQQRRWRVLAPAVAVVSLLTMVVVLLDPQVFKQYWDLMSGPYPRMFASGVSAILRKGLNGDTFGLQFIPLGAGLVWFGLYWRRHRYDWSWLEHTPALVTASLLTSAWGFLFDQALLAIPVIYLAATSARKFGRIPMNLLVPYTILNATLILLVTASSFWAFVPGPVVVAALLWRNFSEHRCGLTLTGNNA